MNHAVKSVSKDGKIHTVTCACGDTFQSIESEALARSYHSGHLLMLKRKADRASS